MRTYYNYPSVLNKTKHNNEVFNPRIHAQHIPRMVLSKKYTYEPSVLLQTTLRGLKLSEDTRFSERDTSALALIFRDKVKRAFKEVLYVNAKLISPDIIASPDECFYRFCKGMGMRNWHQQSIRGVGNWKIQAARGNSMLKTENRFAELAHCTPTILKLAKIQGYTPKAKLHCSYMRYRKMARNCKLSINDRRLYVSNIDILWEAYRQFGQFMTLKHLITFRERYPSLADIMPDIEAAYTASAKCLQSIDKIEDILDKVREQLGGSVIETINKSKSSKTASSQVQTTSFFS